GMTTLNDALIDLVDGKLVEPKEAYMKAVDKANFASMLKQRNHDTSFLDLGQTPAAGNPKPAAAGGKGR
ncbi:MAG TPA: hypothetical protein VHM67_05150, partial [Gemmatimonadaceae bacterium]|nr:hypothetical protein [Gemmatimonadaceae bacterium]